VQATASLQTLVARLDLAVQEPRSLSDGPMINLAEDHDRIALSLNDIVIRRLFAAGLDLQTVLGLVSDDRVADLINHTIGELDQAIRDIRDVIFDRHAPTPDAADG
jgi:hypothetical protein